MARTVFVTGATGAQGGYVARALLSAGHAVHAIARDPSSSTAKALVQLGARVFPGDFDSVDEMTDAALGCDAAFVNMTPVFTDPLGETKRGQNVVAALQQASVSHVVQSSAVGLEHRRKALNAETQSTSLSDRLSSSYVHNKINVEQCVKQGRFARWTILRVPRLLNSYVAPRSLSMFPDLASEQILRTALRPELKQSVLDPLDIGRAARVLFEDESGKYDGQTFEFAQTQATMRDIVDAMNAAVGDDRVRLEYRSTGEAEGLAKADLKVAAELHLNKHPDTMTVDKPEQFGLKLHTASDYFLREQAALGNALRVA